jgi:LPS-assembly protein
LLNKAADEAESSGNVVVRSGKDIIHGDRMVMDIVTKKGSVYNGRMFMSKNHFYIKGDKIMKTGEASYFIENATATTCDGDSPDWRIRSSEMDITIDGYGTAKHGRFEAKGVPVAYSPYFVFPVKTSRQSGLLFPYMSYSRDKLGWDAEIPFYWAISKSMDATFYQRYMSERGLKEGVEFRYAMSPNHYGTFYADFLKDRKLISEKMGNITRNWDGDQKRWSLYFNHISNFSPTFYVRSDIAKVSDNWYFKDFSSHNYYLSNYAKTDTDKFRKISFVGDETINTLTSTVRMVKNWKLYNLTGVMRYTDDFTQQKNDATLQQYPEITLTGMKQPLFKTPVNYELTSLYSYNYRVEGQRGQLFDFKPDFTLPLNLGRYAQLTPKVGFKETVWDRDDKQEDLSSRRGTRQTYNMGAILNTEIQKIFNVGIGNVEKIRHSIKPEVTYNYIPYVEQADIPNYVARVYDQNALIYALTNTLTARLKDKSGKISYRELMRLKLAQLYDFKESGRNVTSVDRDSRPFSFIDAELDIYPFQYLSFSARNKYSVNSGEWRQANYDMTVSDWRGDMINLGYRYTYNKNWGLPDIYNTQGVYARELYTQDPGTSDVLKEITLSLKAVINKNWEATYFQRRNESISTDTERTFGLNYRQQCWSIKVSYSDKLSYDAYGVEKPDRVFTVFLSFYGLGGVGNN